MGIRALIAASEVRRLEVPALGCELAWTQQLGMVMDFRTGGNIDVTDIRGLKKDCVLFYHPSCQALAEKVAATRPGIQVGQIDWGCAPDSGHVDHEVSVTQCTRLHAHRH